MPPVQRASARLCGPDRTNTATQAPVPRRPARKGFRLCITSPVSLPKDAGYTDYGGLAWRSLINGEDSTGSTRR